MKTINQPDWNAIAEPLRMVGDDARTLSEVREARYAVIHAFHFLREHFGMGDKPQATDPPQALEHVQGLARAWNTLGETVFRLSGSEL